MTRRKKEFNGEAVLQYIDNFRVKFSETDALGIVWHGNYVTYLEEGREAFGRKHGVSYQDFEKRGYATPIVNINVDFKKPLRYNDTARIKTTYIDSQAAKILFYYEIYNMKEELVCIGETLQVITDLNGNLILSVPEFLLDWKKSHGL